MIASPGVALTSVPKHLAWRGTIVTNAGLQGTFTAHARLRGGRALEVETDYLGHFRCRGPGCPSRRGFFPTTGDSPTSHVVAALDFGTPKPFVYCYYIGFRQPLPDFRIEGPYNCTLGSPGPTISEGSLSLDIR